MAPLVTLIVSVLVGGAAFVLTLLNIREKLWPKPVKAHPLEAAVRDIAVAVRERGPDSARPHR